MFFCVQMMVEVMGFLTQANTPGEKHTTFEILMVMFLWQPFISQFMIHVTDGPNHPTQG
jgi:hypothetical protein